MTELYLVRHGETALNAKGVYYGWTDCCLSEKGLLQSQQLADILSGIHFDTVIASPLKRAVDTAAIVSGINQADIIKDDSLKELNFGQWEGLHYSTLSLDHKEQWENWHKDWKYAAPPMGERFFDMYERVKQYLEEILARYKDEKILLVSHHGPMRVIMTVLLKLELDGYWHFMFEQGRYSLVQIEDGHCVIKRMNCGK